MSSEGGEVIIHFTGSWTMLAPEHSLDVYVMVHVSHAWL